MAAAKNGGKIIQTLFSGFWQFVREVYLSFCYNHGNMIAAAISYYVYLSAVPLILLAAAGWGYLLGSEQEAQTIIISYVRDFSPSLVGDKSEVIRKLVDDLVSFRGPATWVGTLGLLWGGTGVITVLDKAINHSFGVPGFRGYLKERLLALILLPFMTMLFGLSFIGTGLLHTIRNLDSGIMWLKPSRWTVFWALDSYIVPFLITIVAFVIIFTVLPRKHVPFRVAIAGALFTGVLWELTKQVFGYYAALFTINNRIYGSLGSVILWMLWINASAVVTVMGAEFAAALTRRIENKKKKTSAPG